MAAALYFLEAPVVLTPEDSDLVLAAYPGATPVLSGGRPIAGWKEITLDGKKLVGRRHSCRPATANGYFRELWVNGQRATRARHPEPGLPPHRRTPRQGEPSGPRATAASVSARAT